MGPSAVGSVVIITGASSGIGRFAATTLASLGAQLVLVGRSPERHRMVMSDLASNGATPRLVLADLEDLSSVAAAARSIADSRFDGARVILINNAATAGRRGTTADGFELAFGVNYLAHFLLTTRLLQYGLWISTVVSVSSNAHYSVSKLDPLLAHGKTRSLSGWSEYCHSKAAMAAMAMELAHRNQEVQSVAVHPGLVSTGLWRRIPQPFRALVTRRMVPSSIGALPLVRAATDPLLPSGCYLTPEGVRAPGRAVEDSAARALLWESSLRWVESYQ